MSPTPPPPPGKKWTPAPGGRPNTVGLHERELGDLLDRFDLPDEGRSDVKRDFVRWPYRHTSVQVRLTHPGGAVTNINMACRNISRGGLAALHNSYLHPGTLCRVTLPHPEGPRVLEGKVVRCIHRSGVIHEVGVAFLQPIELADYVRRDALADVFSLERVDPKRLAGTVMVIDGSEIDRRIFKHFLRETPLTIHMAASLEEGLSLLDDTCDLIIADLGMVRDPSFFSTVHHRTPVPVVVASSDTSDDVRRFLGEVPIAAFIPKPMTQRMLLRAIGEFLLVRAKRRVQVQASPDAPDDEAPQLAQNFVAGLPEIVAALEKAAAATDAAKCRTLCLQIAGTAPAVGFKALGRVATVAAESLAHTGSTTESAHEVRTLITACGRTGTSAKAA